MMPNMDGLEALMIEYGVPMPPKPSEKFTYTNEVEVSTDKFIFTQIFVGIQTFIPIHASAFTQSTSPKIRETYKKLLLDQVNITISFMNTGI
jgi:spore coat protein CotF